MSASGVVTQARVRPGLHGRALEMRVEMTPAERRFWDAVRGSQLGVNFRRQQVIGGFIVDFYCASLKRVIATTRERKSLDNLAHLPIGGV